jgi:acyl carrier protein phosphodiesterase
MNYLAHLALSYPSAGLVVGNFIGDHVRNKDLDKFTKEVQLGIDMHRSIDNFTDTHISSINMRKKLFEEYRHISRILVDIYYDHFLAFSFEMMHHQSLEKFNNNVTALLQEHINIMPWSAQAYLRAMQSQNWLLQYSNIDGINVILNKMASRSGLKPLRMGAKTLERNYDFFKTQFLEFYPELIRHCYPFKKEGLH